LHLPHSTSATPRTQRQIRASSSTFWTLIFSIDSLPLVYGDSLEILSRLNRQGRARLLVEGIVGIRRLVSRLAQAGSNTYSRMIRDELRSFSVSVGRAHMVGEIERSPIFSNCLMKSQIVELAAGVSVPVTPDLTFEIMIWDCFGPAYDQPPRNMGSAVGLYAPGAELALCGQEKEAIVRSTIDNLHSQLQGQTLVMRCRPALYACTGCLPTPLLAAPAWAPVWALMISSLIFSTLS